MKIFAVGASKGVGYHSAIRLLRSGNGVTFMLRNPSAFDNDPGIQPFLKSGQATVVKGDAMKEEDVREAWTTASEGGPVSLALFTVGGRGRFVFGRGYVISPRNLCTRSMLNFLKAMPQDQPQLKVIVVSTAGASKLGHRSLPFWHRLLYSTFASQPHEDKLAMDRVVYYAAGKDWPADEYPVKPQLLPRGWEKELPAPGFLKNVLIVKPVLFSGGGCRADAADRAGHGAQGYRVTTETGLAGSYTISREDVAHFIVQDGVRDWDSWNGKVAVVGY